MCMSKSSIGWITDEGKTCSYHQMWNSNMLSCLLGRWHHCKIPASGHIVSEVGDGLNVPTLSTNQNATLSFAVGYIEAKSNTDI